MNSGFCSPPFNKRLVSIFYEVIFNTAEFKNMWYGSRQPFVWSNGDDTGYGLHADFVNGWDVSLLQRAVRDCTADSGVVSECKHFMFFTDEEASHCKIPISVHEQTQGVLSALPGCNKIQSGPQRATPPRQDCGAQTSIGKPIMPSTDVKKKGWKYLGCATDGSPRTLEDERETMADLTVEKCVDYCQSKGFPYAGMEFSDECYCSKNLARNRLLDQKKMGFACSAPCAGDADQICGGPKLLSLYQKCESGKPCEDIVVPFVNGSYVPGGKPPSTSSGNAVVKPTTTKKSAAAASKPVPLTSVYTSAAGRLARVRRVQDLDALT